MVLTDLSYLGKHAYHSNQFFADPAHGAATFSVGIFQWVATRSGDALKESAARVRVVGSPANAAAVWAKCADICGQLDAGTYSGAKHVTLTAEKIKTADNAAFNARRREMQQAISDNFVKNGYAPLEFQAADTNREEVEEKIIKFSKTFKFRPPQQPSFSERNPHLISKQPPFYLAAKRKGEVVYLCNRGIGSLSTGAEWAARFETKEQALEYAANFNSASAEKLDFYIVEQN